MPVSLLFGVKVSQGEYDAWHRFAGSQGVTVPSWVRSVVNREIGHERDIGKRGRKPGGSAQEGDADVAGQVVVAQADAAGVQEEGATLSQRVDETVQRADADRVGGQRDRPMATDRSEPALKNPGFKRHPQCEVEKCGRLRFPCCRLCAGLNRR
jgi:hypothetical protein